ncbi:MAG: LemA family protein [Lachnospiraceae bacterium]|nr:LemA family protein [Lachnospiraceae bacterium]
MIGIIVAVVVVVLLLGWFIGTTNHIRVLEVKINEATSGIDVALEKRYAVLTKQMEVVRNVCSEEQKLAFESIKLRQGMSFEEQNEAIEKVEKLSNGFSALMESYPEMKSNENFALLQKSVNDTEEHLQAARRLFNSNVSAFNQCIVTFPNSIVASMTGRTQKVFFEAEESRKSDVDLSMNI